MLQRRAVIKVKHSLRLVWQNCAARLAKSVSKKKQKNKETKPKKTQITILNQRVPTVNPVYRDPRDPRVQVA